MAAGQPGDRFRTRPPVDRAYFGEAEGFVLDRIEDNLDDFVDRFPGAASEDLVYPPTDHTGWTPGFWTGMLWLAHRRTGRERYRDVAENHVGSFRRRLEEQTDVDCHDVGVVYHLSAVAGYGLTGDPFARETALAAAEQLLSRYHEAPGILQAWGDADDPDDPEYGRTIVDSLIVTPLLYWASEETGEERSRDVARNQTDAVAEHLVREDGSTYHTARFDVETGELLERGTHQGYADDSVWARGQAWALLGFPLAYRHTGEGEYLRVARGVADRYLSGLPDHDVPYWDMVLGGDEPRDSSAAAIAACGLAELADHLPVGDPGRQCYENAALSTLRSLAEDYTTEGVDSNGVLAHAVYNKPAGHGVDECCLWGDYFYLEGLTRAIDGGELFW